MCTDYIFFLHANSAPLVCAMWHSWTIACYRRGLPKLFLCSLCWKKKHELQTRFYQGLLEALDLCCRVCENNNCVALNFICICYVMFVIFQSHWRLCCYIQILKHCPWNRVFLEKLVLPHIVKNFFPFGTWGFSTFVTRDEHCTVLHFAWLHSLYGNPLKHLSLSVIRFAGL